MEERDTNFEEKIMKQQYNNMANFPHHSEGPSEANRGYRQNAVALYDYWQQPSNSFSADSASSSSLSSGSFDHSSEGSPASSPDRRWRPSGASVRPIHHHHYHHHGGHFPRDHRTKKISSPPTTLPKWEPAQCVALDAEMVGVGQYGEDSSIARVVIVDWYGNVLFDEYIKQTQQVTDYRTFISGITEGDLDGAKLSLRDARKHILKILYGRFMIGHGLRNDLKALGISHPWWLIRDTARYEPFMQSLGPDSSLWPRKLKDLSMEKLGSDIQEYGKPHSPFEDAMAALDLYKSVQDDWERLMQAKVAKTNEIRAEERNSFEKAAKQQHQWACHQQYAYMHLQQQMMWQQHAASGYRTEQSVPVGTTRY